MANPEKEYKGQSLDKAGQGGSVQSHEGQEGLLSAEKKVLVGHGKGA